MPQRILVVDDERLIVDSVKYGLEDDKSDDKRDDSDDDKDDDEDGD